MPHMPSSQDKPGPVDDAWPSLAVIDSAVSRHGEGDWEFLDPSDSLSSDDDCGGISPNADVVPPAPPPTPTMERSKILHRYASTPDFGNYDACTESESSASETVSTIEEPHGEEDEDEEDDGTRVTAVTDASSMVVVPVSLVTPIKRALWGSPDPATGGKAVVVRRVPSFAEMVRLNAAGPSEEEGDETRRAEMEERTRRERAERRTARAKSVRLVVTPIKRCTKSTGDLRGLGRIHEYDESAHAGSGFGGDGGGGGGGGGGDGVGGGGPLPSTTTRAGWTFWGIRTQWTFITARPKECRTGGRARWRGPTRPSGRRSA